MGETKKEVREDTQNSTEEQLPQICEEC